MNLFTSVLIVVDWSILNVSKRSKQAKMMNKNIKLMDRAITLVQAMTELARVKRSTEFPPGGIVGVNPNRGEYLMDEAEQKRILSMLDEIGGKKS